MVFTSTAALQDCRNRRLTIQNIAKLKYLEIVVMNKNGMHD
jgi:hypothetical protein